MTDEQADRYVSEALAYHEGWDAFEVVGTERILPALVQAFARRGWSATEQARKGLLWVEREAIDEADDRSGLKTNGPEML